MNKEELLGKLQSVVSGEPVKWQERSEERIANKKWLRRSQAVALLVLRTLRQKGITQKDLALKMNVSPQQVNKWVKGKENFTFETIVRLEEVLEIELMTIKGAEMKSNETILISLDYKKQPALQSSGNWKSQSSIKVIPFYSKKIPLTDYTKAI